MVSVMMPYALKDDPWCSLLPFRLVFSNSSGLCTNFFFHQINTTRFNLTSAYCTFAACSWCLYLPWGIWKLIPKYSSVQPRPMNYSAPLSRKHIVLILLSWLLSAACCLQYNVCCLLFDLCSLMSHVCCLLSQYVCCLLSQYVWIMLSSACRLLSLSLAHLLSRPLC
jgi:hypothetical protein